jgi:hypothetical protein
LFATKSRADEDGLFCTSKGYLAYEVRQGITPGVVGHVLQVVRFEAKRGVYLANEATLVDFEVYHLTCSADHIEISGWNNVFMKYVIQIAGSGELKSLGPTMYPERQWSDAAKDGPAPPSLRIFGPNVAPLSLESFDLGHKYELLRNLSGRKVEEGWEWHSTSELVQLDVRGTVLQRFLLYERRTVEGKE